MVRVAVFTLAVLVPGAALAESEVPPLPSQPARPAPAPAPQPAPPAVQAAPPQPQPYPYPYPYAYPQPYPYPYLAPRPLPAEMPYDPEKPIPQGYKVEERVRKGAVIAGAIVAGVPYAIGLQVAAASGFENKSYWLLVPGIGPFVLIGAREKACERNEKSGENAAECLGDAFLVMALVADGLMQTAGGVVLTVGLTAKKKVLVREQARLELAPVRVGTGHGLGLRGTF